MRRASWLPVAAVGVAALWAAPVTSAAGGDGHGHHGGHHRPPEKKPTAVGSGGAAATVDLLATQAAIDMLRRGGNAVDAAVAAAGVLGVTEPFSAGIGGGGFMVIRTPRGQVTTIDSREKAPAAMTAGLVHARTATPLPFNDARFSGLSAGVPGTVAGWEHALKRYGRTSLGKALRSGIEVARKGFVVDQTFFDQTTADRRLLQRRPVHGRDLPRPRRHAARRRHDAAQPGHGARVRDDRALRRRRLLPRADRDGDGRGRAAARRSPPTRTTSGAPG